MPSRVTVLDVGHGNSAILEHAGGVVVFDCAQGASLLEFLEESGIHCVDAVLLSHADSDHIGGLIQLIATAQFKVGKVLLNVDSVKRSSAWNDLAWELDQLARSDRIELVTGVGRGALEGWGEGDVRIEILAPRPYLLLKGVGGRESFNRRIRSNSLSVVVRVSAGDRPLLLLPGDLDEVGLDSICDDGIDLTAETLVFPHHGGRAGGPPGVFARRLCRLVKPKTVVFSIGRDRYGTPLPEVVEAARRAVPEVRIACTQLSRNCSETVPTADPEHLLPIYSRGRIGRKCCAGSLVVELGEARGGDVLPEVGSHRLFIDASAKSALCRRSAIF